jgi:hypothetical protein
MQTGQCYQCFRAKWTLTTSDERPFTALFAPLSQPSVVDSKHMSRVDKCSTQMASAASPIWGIQT